jgi:RNA polymerase sigma-70 factor (ECF subfamily)
MGSLPPPTPPSPPTPPNSPPRTSDGSTVARDGASPPSKPVGGPDKSNPDQPPTSTTQRPRDGDPRSDEQLLADHLSADPTAFPLLLGRYQRELYHFLVRFLGDRAAAEDVFQEAFLQVHQSADQFDLERRFKPWLFTIAANKARDLMRAQSRRPMSPLQAAISPGDEEGGEFLSLMAGEDNAPDAPMEREELRKKVQSVVLSMPANLREILLLSYFHQFPYKHISDILGIPLGTVKSRLHAAVAHFAARWKGSNPPPSAS